MRGLLLLVKGALKYNVTPQQLKGDLLTLGMSKEGAETMEKVWRATSARVIKLWEATTNGR